MLGETARKIKRAKSEIKAWNKEHASKDNSLFTDELLKAVDNNVIHVALILEVLDATCQICWDSPNPCLCRDENDW